MTCPDCHSAMIAGFVLAREGLFFFRTGGEADLSLFAEALPETAAWMRRAYLEAYKCPACQLVLIRYGRQIEEPEKFEHK